MVDFRFVVVAKFAFWIVCTSPSLTAEDRHEDKTAARSIVKTAFSLRNGWVYINVRGRVDETLLGTDRAFLLTKRNGDLEELLVIEEWEAFRLMIDGENLICDCRGRVEPSLHIRLSARLSPARDDGIGIMKSTGFPDGDTVRLRESLLEAIARGKKIVVAKDNSGFEVRFAADRNTPAISCYYTRSRTHVLDTLSIAKKLFDHQPDVERRVEKISMMDKTFSDALTDWSRPLVLSAERAKPILKRRGVPLPRIGILESAIVTNDVTSVELRVRYRNKTYRLISMTHYKPAYIPKTMVQRKWNVGQHQFTTVYDSGARKYWVYAFGNPYTWMAPIDREEESRIVATLLQDLANGPRKEKITPNTSTGDRSDGAEREKR